MMIFLYAALLAQPKPPSPPVWKGEEGREFAVAIQTWTLCNVYQASKRALTTDSADAIASAAFQACEDEEKTLRAVQVITQPDFTQSFRDGLVDTLKQQQRGVLMKQVNDLRATPPFSKAAKQ